MPIRFRLEPDLTGSVEGAVLELVKTVNLLGVSAVMMLNGTQVWADPGDEHKDVLSRYRTMDEARRIARDKSTALRNEAAASGKIENY